MVLTAVHEEQEFSVGDTVRVHQRIQEDEKTRTQAFEGIVIGIKGEGQNKMFVVRRIGAAGIGIERIFPLYSPIIQRIEVVTKGAVRRAKLYYLREKSAREVAEVTKRRARRQQTRQAAVKGKKAAPKRKTHKKAAKKKTKKVAKKK